jgi:hypothetical protein
VCFIKNQPYKNKHKMKKVMVNTNNIGLITKKGALKRVVAEGSYWLGFGESIEIADMSKNFYSSINIDILLQNQDFRNAITLVEIVDNEIGLVYQNNNFKNVIVAGRHIFWNGLNPYQIIKANMKELEIDNGINKDLLEKGPVSLYVRTFKVEAYEKGLLFIDGKFKAVMEPGSYFWWKNSTVIHVNKTDIRQLSMEIVGQEILTKDKAQLRINFIIQYKVVDIMKALHENKEYEKQLYILMQLALREFIGKLTLDELMESKDQIANAILENSKEHVGELGVSLLYCGLKDIILPGEIKTIMNQVLIAEKKAQANIITRREETASTRSLLNTAKLMEDNNMLFKLKEMEYVEKIAEKINTISLSGGGQIVDQLKQIFVKQ